MTQVGVDTLDGVDLHGKWPRGGANDLSELMISVVVSMLLSTEMKTSLPLNIMSNSDSLKVSPENEMRFRRTPCEPGQWKPVKIYVCIWNRIP